jgi:hypothetical protein
VAALDSAARDARHHSGIVSVLRADKAAIESRAVRALEWAEKNQAGNYAIRACIEWAFYGDKQPGHGSCMQVINPFDRWQIKPALR